jgi:FMN phosphatase YigB (HAD superfamily)
MIKDLKAIGFDIDNTLYVETQEIRDLIQERIVRSAAKLLGRDFSDVEKEYNKHNAILQSGRRSLEALGIKNGVDLVQEALEHTNVASTLHRDERLVSMMKHLASKYKLFLISGSGVKEARLKLAVLGLDMSLFSVTIFAESKYHREDGSAFRHISSELNIPLSQMMFVGDRENVDIVPAASFGLVTAMVNNVSSKATYNLNTIYDLEEILN